MLWSPEYQPSVGVVHRAKVSALTPIRQFSVETRQLTFFPPTTSFAKHFSTTITTTHSPRHLHHTSYHRKSGLPDRFPSIAIESQPNINLSRRITEDNSPKANMAPGRVSKASSVAESSADVSMDDAPAVPTRSSAFANRVSPLSLFLSLLRRESARTIYQLFTWRIYSSNTISAVTYSSGHTRLHGMLRHIWT